MKTSTSTLRAFLAVGALAALSSAWGCVSDRPSRNGVFNENQYVRKDFLIANGDGSTQDQGWFLKATVTQVSTPNLLGGLGIFPGADTGFGTGVAMVRFRVTQDKLQMLNVREISSAPSDSRTEEVINAWPIVNVDLKYRVNLDGEKTNYYEENQELDWAQRQWVKINFAKNDMSDTAPLGNFVSSVLARCTDLANSSATLLPGSFNWEHHDNVNDNYIEWTVNVTTPVKFDDPACVETYSGGPDGSSTLNFGRQNVTFNLKYSLVRAKPLDDPMKDPLAYVPLEVDEKDPIRHKYGAFNIIPIARDTDTHLLAARQLVVRHNPNKPILYYFDKEVPDSIKNAFTKQGGIQDQTNDILKTAGAKATFTVLNYNDATTLGDGKGPERHFGDIRYSFVHWVKDIDENTGWLGYGPSASDPRTGEIIDSTVNISDSITDQLARFVDFYLATLIDPAKNSAGLDQSDMPWTETPCSADDFAHKATIPLSTKQLTNNHNANSTLFSKMQQYLQKPAAKYGPLGPMDFVQQQDADFFNAYYALLPYELFADPDANPFVVREGGKGIFGPASFWDMAEKEAEFHKIAGAIDRGLEPFEDVTGPTGLKNATDFGNHFRDLTTNHKQFEYAKQFIMRQQAYDPPSAFNLTQIASHDARHCIQQADGTFHYETKDEWVKDLTDTFYAQIAIHEFGHTMGLQHNFMGSIDKNNFVVAKDAMGNPIKDLNGNPKYALYTSSVMEYSSRMADMFVDGIWGNYDKGALGWIYANSGQSKPADPTMPVVNISGQTSKTAPWNDPYGWDDAKNKEIQYLYCHHEHLPYTPLCRMFDVGTTPSEIMANAIEEYEWNFNFRNYRVWRKWWDNSKYADAPATLIMEMRRFVSLWLFDWSGAELTDTFRRIGITPPQGIPALQYYSQLTNKFNAELSSANQIVASFHKAIIQQSAGERPVRTIYDKYYGDVTQQGIILDKLFAMQGWVGLWPSDNYDPNQAGSYISSYSDAPDSSYQYSAEDTVDSMIGGQYDAFPYFAPLAVAIFSQDTHSPAFTGRIEVRDWIGGRVFYRLQDFLDYFRDIAVQANYTTQSGQLCTDIAHCDYDPRTLSDQHNEFFGPDKRLWIWAYVPDRNNWVAVQKERNTASYVIVRNYTDDVVFQLDDGSFPGGAYGALLPMKYYLDSFNQYN